MGEALKIRIVPAFLMCPTHNWMMPSSRDEFTDPPGIFWTECGARKGWGEDLPPCGFEVRRKFKMPSIDLEEA